MRKLLSVASLKRSKDRRERKHRWKPRKLLRLQLKLKHRLSPHSQMKKKTKLQLNSERALAAIAKYLT